MEEERQYHFEHIKALIVGFIWRNDLPSTEVKKVSIS
jgi:hypothetical protein